MVRVGKSVPVGNTTYYIVITTTGKAVSVLGPKGLNRCMTYINIMCEETIEVIDLNDDRGAYELVERMKGLPYVQDAEASVVTGTVAVQYDESVATHDTILDVLENNGCKPTERLNGIIGTVRKRLGV
jgi:copper chaperone CopZ